MTSARWLTALFLSSFALFAGACFHIGDQTGTCATGATCTCDGIGNCEEHCPGGGCHFSCTGIGNCNVTCEGGGCDLSCTGTGNCNLDCQGGNCQSNCLGRTNCICRNCNEFDGGVAVDGGGDTGPATDTGVTPTDAAAEDSGPPNDANVDAPADDAYVAPNDANVDADTGPDA